MAKKKLWEILSENAMTDEERQEEVKKANQKFNEYVAKNGTYNTDKHTTTPKEILDSMSNKEQRNAFRNNNNLTLWGQITNIAKNNGAYIAKKTYAGLLSGVIGIGQAGLTDVASNVKKGKEKNTVSAISDVVKGIANINNPGLYLFDNLNPMEMLRDNKKILNDNNKNILEKAVGMTTNNISKAINNVTPVKTLFNNTQQAMGKVLPQLEDDLMNINNNISKPVEKISEELEKEGQKYGKVTNVLADVGQGVGNMIPSIGATAITRNPTVGLATMGISTKGQATQEALNKGADLETAVKIGDTKGMIEIGTEMLSGGVNIFGKGALDSVVKNGIEKKVKNNVLKYLAEKGYSYGGEVGEEVISDTLGMLIDKGTIDKDAKYTLNDFGNTAVTTILTTAVLNALTGGIGSVGGIIKNRLNTNNENPINPNNTSQVVDNVENNNSNYIMTKQRSNADMQNYQYQKSDNIKIDNLRQDASRYFDNSEKTQNFVNMLEKIVQDKDVDIRFDDTLVDDQGSVANGKYQNGVITINPNSTRAGEFIAIHELTHAIGTKDMIDIVNNYRKSNTEFDTAVQNLLKNYNQTEITEEALADVSAQLLGNQEFINNLSQTNPSIFKKIYNEIKYLWHQFRGYKNQNQFIEDLQYKWEQAYRNNNELNNATNYYIEPIAKFDELQYNNIQGLILNNKEDYALRQIVNSDSNVKPGINRVETTNATYMIYYKEIDDFKVMTRKVDKNAGKLNQRNDYSRGKTRYSRTYSEFNGNEISTGNNDEIPNINSQGESERSRSTTSSPKNIRNGGLDKTSSFSIPKNIENLVFNKEFYEQFKNEDKTKITESIEELEKQKEKLKPSENDLDWDKNFEINQKIRTIKKGYDNIYDMLIGEEKNRTVEDYKYNPEKYEKLLKDNNKKIEKEKKLQKEIKEATPLKRAQYEVIQANNPMFDDEHVGIRSPADIKTFDEIVDDRESFTWGDYTKEDAQKDLKRGKVVIYSSYPIKQGVFVSTSRRQAQEYAGGEGNRVYSKEVYLNRVAWINGDEGQYANVGNKSNRKLVKKESAQSQLSMQKDNQGRQLSKEQQNYFKDSKVRDKSGNLLTVYHGTTNKFNIFNYDKLGENTSSLGAGFYFTDQKATGEAYTRNSGYLKEVYLDIKKPMGYMEKLMTKKEYQNLIEAVNKETNGNYLADYDGLDNALMEYDYGGDDIDLVNAVHEASGLTWEKTYDILRKTTGFDGIITKEGFLNKGEKLYVVFNPNQIKNVDNVNPTDNPDIRYSKNSESWQEYLEENFKSEGTKTNLQDIRLPTRETIQENKSPNVPVKSNVEKKDHLNNITNIEEPKVNTPPMENEKLTEKKIAKILTEPITKQKPKQRTWAILTANLIDKGAVFETLSLKTKNRELQAKYDATLSSSAKGQYAIGNDRYIYENGKKKIQSKSLSSIIEEVGENPSDFYNYMYHQLNIDRMTLEERFGGDTGINYERKYVVKNKPVFGNDIDAEYSRQKVAEYEKKYPEFKSYAQDVYDFLDANKQEMVDKGVISQELSDMFKERYPHYVPIARVGKNNNSIQVPLDTQSTGINSPIKRAKGGSQDIQPLFHTIADKTMQTYRASARNSFGVELKNTLEQNGLLNSVNEYADIDTIMDTITEEQQTGLTEGTENSNPTFTVYENGKKVTYEINQDMYDALKPQNELINKFNNTKLSKTLNTISNIRRGILTEYNPLFSISNALKDSQDVLLNSQHAKDTYKKFPEAYAQILKKGYWYNEYIQNGGEQNSYFKDGEFELINNKSKAKKVISMPFEAVSKINNVIEMAPRLSEYIASREKGKSIEGSMLDASRVTTNFKAGGDITKTLNRNGATFLNAGVQGMAQQVRNIREAHAKGLKGYAVLIGKAVISGIPAILLNHVIWSNDDDYDELQDYVKDNYYIVAKMGEHDFIRIPKGRTTAVIQKMVSNIDQYITKKKEINIDNFSKDFWGMLSFTTDNIAPNNPIDNNIISPIVQVSKNKSWYGEDIVPSRLQNVPIKEQYDETTDKFSKWLGEVLNISPMKINYLLDQYGGGISDVLLPIGTPQAESNPIADKFTTNSVIKNKRPGEFYEKLQELTINNNSLNATDEDILKYKYMSSANEEISKLYKQKREEQNSNDNDKIKKQKITNIQNKINELSKKSLNNVNKLKMTDNTAIIGDEKYYKNINLQDESSKWEKLSENEIQKNKNISLETYADYKEKVAKETINKRKNGELKESQSLKNIDKTKIIVKSDYSDNEKLEIYKNYIGTEDKKVKLIEKLDFPISQYLEYKTHEFKNDKDKNGETIKGSKKQKVYKYLNNNKELPLIYKKMICKLEDINDKEYNRDIVNFINDYKGLDKKERKELLEIVGFKVDKNGYISTTTILPIKTTI